MGGRERGTEKMRGKEREFNSTTLFYMDWRFGSVKTCLTTSTCYATSEWETDRQRDRGRDLCLCNCTVCIPSSCLQRTWLSNRVVSARAVLSASSSVRFGTRSLYYYSIPMQWGAYWDIPFICRGYTSPRLASKVSSIFNSSRLRCFIIMRKSSRKTCTWL